MRFLAPLLLAIVAPAAAQPAPTSAGVYGWGEVQVLPRLLNSPGYITALGNGYPAHLRAAGVGGTVQVVYVVPPDGRPRDVQVLASPDTGFNAPTVQAVSLLRFTPGLVQGRPVATRVEQAVTWSAELTVPPADGYDLVSVEELPHTTNAPAFQRALQGGYPPSLKAAGINGTVYVRFRVELDGTTAHPMVTFSTNCEFDEPTLRALEVLRFRPGKANGQLVRVWVELPVQWTVPSDPPASPELD